MALSSTRLPDITDEALLALATQVGQALRERGWTLAVAESCTGGLLGHWITEVPGSSAYFVGGVIAYSNEVKQHWLGVPEAVLRHFGAVSAECARAMAEGVRQRFHATVALSITGIAGPTGGPPEKPVGLTFIHLATPEGGLTERHVWPGTRHENKRASVAAALDLLRRYTEGPLRFTKG